MVTRHSVGRHNNARYPSPCPPRRGIPVGLGAGLTRRRPTSPSPVAVISVPASVVVSALVRLPRGVRLAMTPQQTSRLGATVHRTPRRGGRHPVGAGRVPERLEGALLAVDLAVGARGLLPVAFDLRGLLAAGSGEIVPLIPLYLSSSAEGARFDGSAPRPSGNGGGPGRGWMCLHFDRVSTRGARLLWWVFRFPWVGEDVDTQRTKPDPRMGAGVSISRGLALSPEYCTHFLPAGSV